MIQDKGTIWNFLMLIVCAGVLVAIMTKPVETQQPPHAEQILKLPAFASFGAGMTGHPIFRLVDPETRITCYIGVGEKDNSISCVHN